ncbi:low molecular weight protein-tyrosine-phosphatase [Marinobacter sp. Hex_13]|uniref:low molecular weight protein-tyrosine-phosphatase n=1 Tax=Marinobacter sp. Hex_13 TaxID=1795866 RepID=UPI00079110F5|nr:low molecular weight protein-tyrosine-phosphatase [Marinobacter sp. Hex_13]KXJ42454.1 MAG: phosphotyrosine protein phosphatase [Marinobacter sp. Hex_13]
MFNKILVVCVGNICRSPTAEVLLKHRLQENGKEIAVDSAGLGALVGKDIEPTARQVLVENGIEPNRHSAKQINIDMIAQADLVLAMEQAHLQHLNEIAPQARGKTFLLGKWLDNKEIPDPYRQQKPAFDHAYTLIDQSIAAWLKYL